MNLDFGTPEWIPTIATKGVSLDKNRGMDSTLGERFSTGGFGGNLYGMDFFDLPETILL